MVLVEAQACGKPVIAGDSGGTAETMRAGETGRVVPCDGLRALERVVAELLRNEPLRRQMGAAGRHWVERRFNWQSLSLKARQIFAERKSSMKPGLIALGMTETTSG